MKPVTVEELRSEEDVLEEHRLEELWTICSGGQPGLVPEARSSNQRGLR